LNYFSKKKVPIPSPPPDPTEDEYLRETIQELTSIMSNEWLKEVESSSGVIRMNCQIGGDMVDVRSS
jgi:hypothetical protein